VTDESDGLSVVVHLADDVERFGHAADLVGRVTAWDDERVELAGTYFIDLRVDRNWVSLLSEIRLLPDAGDHDGRALFHKPVPRILELHVLVFRTGQDQDFLTFELHRDTSTSCFPPMRATTRPRDARALRLCPPVRN